MATVRRLRDRMDCPHCGHVLTFGKERCKVCFGKIAYRKAPILNRLARVTFLAAVYCALLLSEHCQSLNTDRVLVHCIVFLLLAVGLWNHRQAAADKTN